MEEEGKQLTLDESLRNHPDFIQHERDGCGLLGVDWHWGYNIEGERYCDGCGWVDPTYKDFDETAPKDIMYPGLYSVTVQHRKRRRVSRETRDYYSDCGFKFDSNGGVITQGIAAKSGRYKPRFHLNERISQWGMDDPVLPKNILEWLLEKAQSGNYGPIENFRRGTVLKLLKDCGQIKYREKWKSILHKINPTLPLSFPPYQLVDYIQVHFSRMLEEFYQLKHTMPRSITKTIKGETKTRVRHNFISFNYCIRKIMESLDIYQWHDEFPVPISTSKLLALDNIMEVICAKLQFPFTRSVLIKRPKFKIPRRERERLKTEKQQLNKDMDDLIKFMDCDD